MLPCAFIMLLIPNRMLSYTGTRKQSDSTDKKIESTQQIDFSTEVLEILRNKLYMYIVICISCLYFIVTGIQFWVPDYMCTVLNVNKDWIFPIYAIVTVTAPTLGILMGGSAVHKIGGYRSNHVLTLCMGFGFAACCCALPLPFLNVFPVFISFLWLVLFFGAGIMPGATGVMLGAIKKRSRTLGTSLAASLNNLLGFLPAPFLYGLVCDYTGGDKSRYGMGMIMYWSLLAQLFLCLAFILKRRQYSKRREICV
jgi:sugar phosphate permease